MSHLLKPIATLFDLIILLSAAVALGWTARQIYMMNDNSLKKSILFFFRE